MFVLSRNSNDGFLKAHAFVFAFFHFFICSLISFSFSFFFVLFLFIFFVFCFGSVQQRKVSTWYGTWCSPAGSCSGGDGFLWGPPSERQAAWPQKPCHLPLSRGWGQKANGEEILATTMSPTSMVVGNRVLGPFSMSPGKPQRSLGRYHRRGDLPQRFFHC